LEIIYLYVLFLIFGTLKETCIVVCKFFGNIRIQKISGPGFFCATLYMRLLVQRSAMNSTKTSDWACWFSPGCWRRTVSVDVYSVINVSRLDDDNVLFSSACNQHVARRHLISYGDGPTDIGPR